MKVFVVTTVVKQFKEQEQVVLGVYQDREQAQQRAIDSMSEERGVLSDFLAWRKKQGYEDKKGYEIFRLVEGNSTKGGRYYGGADWHTGRSFGMAAKVEEVELYESVS